MDSDQLCPIWKGSFNLNMRTCIQKPPEAVAYSDRVLTAKQYASLGAALLCPWNQICWQIQVQINC